MDLDLSALYKVPSKVISKSSLKLMLALPEVDNNALSSLSNDNS